MTATRKGFEGLSDFLASLPANLEQNVLRGALRAGAEVIADGAREECRSDEVRAKIKTTSRAEKGLVTAKVQTKSYKAPWLENGTDPHFISVDSEQSGGRTVKRVNREVKRGTLVINGKAVGATVHHPGAKPYPFMRPAADTRADAAANAVAAHIAKKATKAAIETPDPPEPEE